MRPIDTHAPPAGYVQAAPTITHGDSIPEGLAMFQIDAGQYPAIVLALNVIGADSGGPSWPAEQTPMVPERWRDFLDQIEAALFALSTEAPAPEDAEHESGSEFEAFCMGEHTVMSAIVARSHDLLIAANLLNDFFEGWTYFEDEGLFDPRKALGE